MTHTLVRRAAPVLGLIGTVLAVWLLFERHEFTRREDGVILLFIGGAYVVAIAFLLVYTERWAFRALGQVATYAADAMIYLGSGLAALHWRHRMTPQEFSLIRAAFVVGGTCLVGGLIWWRWSVRTRRGTADPESPLPAPADQIDVVTAHTIERRSGAPGRRATDGRR